MTNRSEVVVNYMVVSRLSRKAMKDGKSEVIHNYYSREGSQGRFLKMQIDDPNSVPILRDITAFHSALCNAYGIGENTDRERITSWRRNDTLETGVLS